MNCRKVTSLFTAYLEKKLDTTQFDAVTSHLQHCSECSKAIDFIENSLESVQYLSDSRPEVTDFFTERVLAKIQTVSETSFSPALWITTVLFKRTSVLAASVAALFAGVIFGIFLNLSTAQLKENEIASESQTWEEVYLAGTSNEYMMQFFDNLYYKENGNE